MQIRVRPAEREGSSSTIFNRALVAEDVQPGTAEAWVVLSIDTSGIYPDGSTYRYELEFAAEELRSLVDVATGQASTTSIEIGSSRSVTPTESGESASPILR